MQGEDNILHPALLAALKVAKHPVVFNYFSDIFIKCVVKPLALAMGI